MKTLLSMFLALVATGALAGEPTLDVAKVVSISDIPNVCDVVPATMVYIDHQGQTHSVTYMVMGDCGGPA